MAGSIQNLHGWAATKGLPLAPKQYGAAMFWRIFLTGTLLVARRVLQTTRLAQIVVAIVCGALLANLAAHFMLSILTRSLMPGLFTAVALVLPSAGWLLARLPLSRQDRRRAGLAGAAAMPLVAGATLLPAG